MQAQANRTGTKAISSTQSLAAVQTLLRAGLGCITFMRDLLPQDNFVESRSFVESYYIICLLRSPGHFTTSDDSMSQSSQSTLSSPATEKKKNLGGFKIMVDEYDR